MNLLSSIFTPSILLIPAAILFLISISAWLIHRIKQDIDILPILAIMPHLTIKKPRIRLQQPPLIPFFSFLTLAIMAQIFLMKPHMEVFKPQNKDKKSVHYFIDLSPSVAGSVSIDAYIKEIQESMTLLNPNDSLSVSLSDSHQIHRVKQPSDIDKLLRSHGFHRQGLDIGGALNKQLGAGASINKLVIFSDQDYHSWQRFNWQYLENKMEVYFYNLDKLSENSSNIFIGTVRLVRQTQASRAEWDVELSKSGDLSLESQGILTVHLGQQKLASTNWLIPKQQNSATIRMTWSKNILEAHNEDKDKTLHLVWSIQPSANDQIALDNIFHSEVNPSPPTAMIIADTAGEQTLEDPAHQLQVSLEVSGIQVKRYDWIKQDSLAGHLNDPLWIFFVGEQNDIDSFCPINLLKNQTPAKKNHPTIWLSPYSSSKKQLQNVCWCYDQLSTSQTTKLETMPSYCSEISDRSSFAYVFKSLGATPLGGHIEQSNEAIIWKNVKTSGNSDILAFNLALRPSKEQGINHAQLPLLIKQLLEVEGIQTGNDSKLIRGYSWPRVSYISEQKSWLSNASDSKPSEPVESNVPIAESQLKLIQTSQLPPDLSKWNPKAIASDMSHKKEQDPLPWLKIFLIFLISCIAAEVIWIIRERKNQVKLTQTMLALLLGSNFYQTARSEIHLAILSRGNYNAQFKSLAKSVQNQTSISLSSQVHNYHSVSNTLLLEPLIWASDPQIIKNKQQKMDPKLAIWLKRGGMLIVQNARSLEELKTLTSSSLNHQRSPGKWLAIPPDHELMRSFYLLEALPPCNNHSWYGYQFDDRLAILALPFNLLDTLNTTAHSDKMCQGPLNKILNQRIFINTLMTALTTDYKKDQIHMKEILKRL